jgi:atypical dual specificity phosphatase
VNKVELLYEVSLWNTVLLNAFNSDKYPWNDEIIDGLFLGAQPMLNYQHHEELSKKGVTAILTMLEQHEYGSSLFTEPVHSSDWKKLGIQQKIIDTSDFLPVSQDKIEEGVKFIHEELKKGGKVKIHCKAGRGRSATVVVCYLLKYGIKDKNGKVTRFGLVDGAINFVKSKRTVISINSKQRAAIQYYQKNRIRSKEELDEFFPC